MTDQVPTEYVFFKGKSYVPLAAERMLFSPWDHDIRPDDADSSNWAGFVAHFDVRDERLYLNYLTVGHVPPKKRSQRSRVEGLATLDDIIGDYTLPPLNGVEPTNAGMGYWHYQNINLVLDYTGFITLGSEPSWKQPNHRQLVFEKGRLVSVRIIEAPTPAPDALSWAEPEDPLLDPWDDFDFDSPRSENNDLEEEPPQQP